MKASEIASILEGELSGQTDLEISGVSSLKDAAAHHLTFLSDDASETDFSGFPVEACILVPRNSDLPDDVNAIRVDNPKLAFAKITPQLKAGKSLKGIHPNLYVGVDAVVDARYIGANVSIGKGARIGVDVEIHDGAVVGDHSVIGAGTIIYSNAVVYERCRIGDHCILHAGTVIGAAGFGYVRDRDEIVQFPQIGTVVIENNVEVGANSCIDRGALGETRIGSDTKIDNLVQIAHNVFIGKRVLIAAQVGISGSVVIEDDVVIGGQVGIADHVTIKSGAVIGARSAVFPGKIVRAGVWAGSPVQPIDRYKEQNALLRSLSRMKKEIYEIRKKLG